MAYNNGFPINYQQLYPNLNIPPVPTPAPAPAVSNSIIWVQGEAGAKSYLVAPNNTVQLWDSESQTIYLKSADASGMPSMRILDYTIRDMPKAHQQQNKSNIMPVTDYPTRKEFDDLKYQLDKVMKELGINEGVVNG